jgi:hypothetical protein
LTSKDVIKDSRCRSIKQMIMEGVTGPKITKNSCIRDKEQSWGQNLQFDDSRENVAQIIGSISYWVIKLIEWIMTSI